MIGMRSIPPMGSRVALELGDQPVDQHDLFRLFDLGRYDPVEPGADHRPDRAGTIGCRSR